MNTHGNGKKVWFFLLSLLSVFVSCYLYYIISCRYRAHYLQACLHELTEQQLRKTFPELETLQTELGTYACLRIPSDRVIFPNGIVIIKMPNGHTRAFYGGQSVFYHFLKCEKKMGMFLLDMARDDIMAEGKPLDLNGAMEASMIITLRKCGYKEL